MPGIKKAMILAAGFGTRLKPLTDSVPKALVKVNGIPMIEHVINKLVGFGISYIVINTHHFAGQIEDFFNKKDFGVEIKLLYEKEILGTGGGIKNASEFLNDSGPFLVHNVDVVSEIDFDDLVKFHSANSDFVTLAVKKRDTKRPLIFDEEMNLIGRASENKSYSYRNGVGEEKYFGFCGIHVISTEIFENFNEKGFFDIFTPYFRLVSTRIIKAYDIKSAHWQDVGKLDFNIHSF
jgi:N-acetyl-alpha-D-muramate 1-phosphate uridylyltransferase